MSISQVPAITRMVKPSLACFVAHPFGLTMGALHDRATHRAVLGAMLAAAAADHPAGTIVPTGMRWTTDDLRDRQLRKEAL